jgi:hypothetical protein
MEIDIKSLTVKNSKKEITRNFFITISGNFYKLYFHKYIQYYLYLNRVRIDLVRNDQDTQRPAPIFENLKF